MMNKKENTNNLAFMISSRIKTRMEALGLSQSDVCRKTNIDKSALSNYLAARYAPKESTLIKLADCLQTTVEYLRGYDDSPNPIKWDSESQEVWQEMFSGIGERQIQMLARINQDDVLRQRVDSYLEKLVDILDDES